MLNLKRHSRILLAWSVVGVAAAIAITPARAAPYSVVSVSYPGDPAFTQLLGINNAGLIAGFHGALVSQGFTLTLPGTFTTENFPGAAQTMVTAVNGNGNTAGIFVDAAGVTHGFKNTGGIFLTVDRPNTAFNQALGINNGGTTVGYSSTNAGGQVLQLAYSQSNGVFTDINGLLPVNMNSQAVGINNANSIVGFYMPTFSTAIGFLDIGNTISTIDPFGSSITQALGINGSGEIVGFYTDAAGFQHGYTDIGGTFATFDPSGSTSTTINGVNDLGQLVGFYTSADHVVGFVATPTAAVPEPATISLFAVGLLVSAAYRRATRSAA